MGPPRRPPDQSGHHTGWPCFGLMPYPGTPTRQAPFTRPSQRAVWGGAGTVCGGGGGADGGGEFMVLRI